MVEIIDADTVLVGHGTRRLKVRLLKLDAPEKGQPFSGGRGDAGAVAKACATGVIGEGKVFELRVFRLDIYQRFLGELEDLSLRLVRNGCSGIYPYATFGSKREKGLFLRALSRAKRERVGLWGSGGYRKPVLWRKASRRSARRR